MLLNTNYGMEGYFRLVVRKKNGNVVCDTGNFKNIITNYGMNRIGGQLSGVGIFGGCTVGTGTTPESVNDISIQSYLARTDNFSSSPANAVGSTVEPYYAIRRATWRFPAGAVVGNISEVGVIANYAPPNYELWSRTLIKDSSGSPITITVLSDEVLDVYYEARVYLQSSPTTGTANILGSTYSYRVNNRLLTSAVHADVFRAGFASRISYNASVQDGPLGPSPAYATTGTQSATSNSTTPIAYTTNSFASSTIYTFSPGTATWGVRSFNMNSSNQGAAYALELTPAFEKSATVELKVTHTVTWSRRSI